MMRYPKKSPGRARGAALLAALALTAGGCDDGLADLNENPNDPVEVSADYLFPNAVEAAVGRVVGAGLNVDLVGLWVQHYAEFEIPIEDLYELTDSRVSAHWDGFWVGPMQDLQEVIEEGQAMERPNTEAMGLIMKAWTAQAITDLYGDIGYSEALRGRDQSSGTTVSYDTQEEVYRTLIDEVTTAAGLLDPDALHMEDADLIYDGDMDRWARFANSLRMRLAMRLSDVAAGYAAEEFQAAYAAGGFGSNDDSAILWYLDDGVNRHPVHVLYLSPIKHSLSSTLVDTLQSLADPRLPVFAQANAFGEYRGAPNGSLPHEAADSMSLIGTFYSRADAPGKLLTYAEVLFLQAEAAERGWIADDAASLYAAGIRASMEFNGVAESDIVDYLAQPEVVYAGGAAGLDQIALQKWIALFGNGLEAYSEWRRTGIPVLEPGPDVQNDGLIPVRLFYPASEQSLNGAAVEEARARQDGATMNSRVWWDTEPNQ
jgi:hypothetical protein